MKKMVILFLLFTLVVLAPVQAGASSTDVRIDGPSSITKEQYSILSMSEILNLYSSPLGNVTIISDNFTGNGAVLGTYSLELYASRFSESVTKEVEINVIKSIGYGVKAVTDGRHLHISTAIQLTPQNILKIHNNVGLLSLNETTQVGIINDTYSKNYKQPGKYLYEYRVMDATGLDMTVAFYISVYENNIIENPIVIETEKPQNNLDKLKEALLTGVVILVLFFVGRAIYKKSRRT